MSHILVFDTETGNLWMWQPVVCLTSLCLIQGQGTCECEKQFCASHPSVKYRDSEPVNVTTGTVSHTHVFGTETGNLWLWQPVLCLTILCVIRETGNLWAWQPILCLSVRIDQDIQLHKTQILPSIRAWFCGRVPVTVVQPSRYSVLQKNDCKITLYG